MDVYGAGKCSHPGCTRTYDNYAWGRVVAGREGWFFQRSGEAWCPDHHPEWVAAWRAQRHAT